MRDMQDAHKGAVPGEPVATVAYGDATTTVTTFDYTDRCVMRIDGGNGWTWLDAPSRLALATALVPPGYRVELEGN